MEALLYVCFASVLHLPYIRFDGYAYPACLIPDIGYPE